MHPNAIAVESNSRINGVQRLQTNNSLYKEKIKIYKQVFYIIILCKVNAKTISMRICK